MNKVPRQDEEAKKSKEVKEAKPLKKKNKLRVQLLKKKKTYQKNDKKTP